jgi:hypothetical protein
MSSCTVREILYSNGVAEFITERPRTIPTQTKLWFRPKGWFTEREEVIMVNRILRDDPSKGDMHNRQAVDLKGLWLYMKDYNLWPIYIISLVFQIPTGSPNQYLTLTLRNLGFDTFAANLRTIPSQVAGAVSVSCSCCRGTLIRIFAVSNISQMLLITFFSEYFNERSGTGALAQPWILPNVIALAALPAMTSP